MKIKGRFGLIIDIFTVVALGILIVITLLYA